MQLLDHYRELGRQTKSFRVSEIERRIFDALKIITEANWVINGGAELRTILIEIGVDYNGMFKKSRYIENKDEKNLYNS
jgi:hypothetical protein